MELVIEFLLFFIELMFWVFVIDLVVSLFAGSRKLKTAEREELVEQVAKKIHQVKQEKHGDAFYWFDAETDQFLGQGCTDEEIRVHLLERFKGHIFLIDEKRAMAGPELKLMPIDQIVNVHEVTT